MGYTANYEMDDSDETQLAADELNSVRHNAMNFNVEEPRGTHSHRVSHRSTLEISKIEPPMVSTNDQNMTDAKSDVIVDVNSDNNIPNDSFGKEEKIESMHHETQHNNPHSTTTTAEVDPIMIDTDISTGATWNAFTAPSPEVTHPPPPAIPISNRDNNNNNAISIPPSSLQQHHVDIGTASSLKANQPLSSVEGNDRVTLDQPPNVALCVSTTTNTTTTNTMLDPPHIRTTPSPNPKSQNVAVVIAKDSNTDAMNLCHTRPPTTAIDAAKTLVQNKNPTATTTPAVTVVNRPKSTSISYSSSDDRAPPPEIQQTAQQVAEEEAIAALRAPLVNRYGPYLCHSTDTSLADARKRLRKAITQTRSLRQTFTERVYGKYRVCLRPPPTADDIIAKIEADPVNELRKLKEEIATVREEKEIEKKEAAKLNNEMSQSTSADRVPALSNIDNAEQLMFLTAGLNLVILPEEQSEEQLRAYMDAYSQSSTTGRTRSSISQAAASAGEVILDRARKAAAMRVERQRRRQLQLLRGEVLADGESESNYSRLQVLKTAGASTKTVVSETTAITSKSQSSTANVVVGAKQSQSSTRRVPATSTKGGRSRSQSSLPTSTLLSINPSADEVKIDGNPSAATLALMARGVGQTMTKSTQQRLRHPHPESLGGRRRANMNPGSVKKDDDITLPAPPEPFLQSNLANTLPPLPAAKERLERKRMADEYLDTPATRKARHSVQCILNNFIENSVSNLLKPISKINLLNSIRKESLNLLKDSTPSIENQNSTTSDALESSDTTLNLPLTMSVLYALGIVGRSQPCCTNHNTAYTVPDLNIENKALCSDRLLSLKGKINSAGPTLTQTLERREEEPVPVELSRKRTRSSNIDTTKTQVDHHSSATSNTEHVVDEDVCNPESVDSVATPLVNSATSINPSAITATTSTTALVRPKKRQRSSSSPTWPSSTGPQISADQFSPPQHIATAPINFHGTSTMGPPQAHFAQNNAMNMFQFAHQLHHMHHPSAGDLAEYLGSFQQHQQGYDLPRILAGTMPSPLSVFGLMQPIPSFPGYTIQDRAATARAMIVREQHAAALLGGYQMTPPPPPFSQLQTNPFTMGQTVQSLVGHPEIRSQQTSDDCPMSEPIGSTIKANPMNNSNNTTTLPISTETEKESVNAKVDRAPETKLTLSLKVSDSTSFDGLQFVAPTCPSNLQSKHKEHIISGLFHQVAEEVDPSDCNSAIDYLLSVGAAIPIPKALVLAPLKERLNTPGFKNANGNNTPLITRDVVAATILVWLWATQEQTFQKAFQANGRIDVDADCKWLIQAAVDTAVSELSLEIAESIAKGEGKFAESSAFRKAIPTLSSGPSNSEMVEATHKLDICTAAIVSKALSTEMCINPEMNSVVPKTLLLIDFLDEARLGALRVKSQERTLLATLIARNTFLSENFAHAYVSAIVRAGEALKHGRLFEIAQDETVMASTMIPYDIFTDDTGAWEDPCKPDDGFTAGLSGEELARRAHARAMVQKSLRKLQDRHHIRGGTTMYGPFVDPESDASRTNTSSVAKERQSLLPQRSGLKRRVSSMMEPPIVPGTGSAIAKSWGVYHPRHVSVPLEWDRDDAGNLPYGLNPRSRFLSFSHRRNIQDSSGSKGSVGIAADGYLQRSTSEINWVDVASTFQSVEVPRKASRYKVIEPETHVNIDGTIFAPFYEEINADFSTDEDDTEEDSKDVEDLSEATVLARHQVVLDSMKAKLEAYLDAQKFRKCIRQRNCDISVVHVITTLVPPCDGLFICSKDEPDHEIPDQGKQR